MVLSHSIKNFYDLQMKSTLQGRVETASDTHRGWQKNCDVFAKLQSKAAVPSAMVHLMPMQGWRVLYLQSTLFPFEQNNILVLRTAVIESQQTTETCLLLRHFTSPTFSEDKTQTHSGCIYSISFEAIPSFLCLDILSPPDIDVHIKMSTSMVPVSSSPPTHDKGRRGVDTPCEEDALP